MKFFVIMSGPRYSSAYLSPEAAKNEDKMKKVKFGELDQRCIEFLRVYESEILNNENSFCFISGSENQVDYMIEKLESLKEKTEIDRYATDTFENVYNTLLLIFRFSKARNPSIFQEIVSKSEEKEDHTPLLRIEFFSSEYHIPRIQKTVEYFLVNFHRFSRSNSRFNFFKKDKEDKYGTKLTYKSIFQPYGVEVSYRSFIPKLGYTMKTRIDSSETVNEVHEVLRSRNERYFSDETMKEIFDSPLTLDYVTHNFAMKFGEIFMLRKRVETLEGLIHNKMNNLRLEDGMNVDKNDNENVISSLNSILEKYQEWKIENNFCYEKRKPVNNLLE